MDYGISENAKSIFVADENGIWLEVTAICTICKVHDKNPKGWLFDGGEKEWKAYCPGCIKTTEQKDE